MKFNNLMTWDNFIRGCLKKTMILGVQWVGWLKQQTKKCG